MSGGISGAVLVEPVSPEVGMVVLNRPPANYVDADSLAELAGAVESLGDRRAIVLAAEGKHFCAGAQLTGGGRHAGATGAGGTHIYDWAIRLFEQPVPIVAALQGGAIGAGLGLALAADFRVVTPDTRFTANFTRLGFHPGFGLSVTLPRLVGPQRAADLLLTGRPVRGAEAVAIGLADHLAEPAELRARAVRLAGELAAAAPLAVRSVRATLRGELAGQVRAAMAHERAEQARLMQTRDFAEGVAAAGARRDPVFEGR